MNSNADLKQIGQNAYKKIKIERSNKSCLVWIVSVLNVLGKAVLGPVDLLTVHRILEITPELVVLRHRAAQNLCSSY